MWPNSCKVFNYHHWILWVKYVGLLFYSLWNTKTSQTVLLSSSISIFTDYYSHVPWHIWRTLHNCYEQSTWHNARRNGNKNCPYVWKQLDFPSFGPAVFFCVDHLYECFSIGLKEHKMWPAVGRELANGFHIKYDNDLNLE